MEKDFQEIDIAGITMPITKHNYIVKDVNQLADTIRRAFGIARRGRPGPVLIDIPKDVTANMAEYEPKEDRQPRRECVDEVGLQAAADYDSGGKKAVYLRRRRCSFSDAAEKLLGLRRRWMPRSRIP